MEYMKQWARRLGIVCLSSVSLLQADTIDSGDSIDQKDINALREWINTKRQVTVRELGGALSISGEVRTEFQSTTETVKGIRQRGVGGAIKSKDGNIIPSDGFDIEVNLMLDYRTERSWGSVKLEFDNAAGVFSGTLNKLKLERAYWGVRFVDADTFSMDIEAGRRRMSSMADSKIEFNSFFDGIWYKYDQSFDQIGDYYFHVGAFVIDENNTQFGYLGETGIFNIADTGLYMKYSLVDWDTKHFAGKAKGEFSEKELEKQAKKRRYRFIVSQFLLGYRFVPQKFDQAIECYVAGLYNHVAKGIPDLTHNKKANMGGYIGVSVGELKKKGDWAFDINYQVLQAQCVPSYDVQGIGLGNAEDVGFYQIVPVTKSFGTTYRPAGRGNVNYRGFQVTLDWLLTNQLDFQQSWQQSQTLDRSIGPFRRYKQYEIEFIYGF